MLTLTILLAVVASFYWTISEFILSTFKDAARKRPYLILFALIGLTIPLALCVISFVFPRVQSPEWLALSLWALCPSVFAQVVFIDIPHPPLTWKLAVLTFIAVMNSALYAAIGARVSNLIHRHR